MKRKIDWRSFWWGWVCEGALILVLQLLLLLCGCTPHAAPIDIMPERVGPLPQRTIDLQHECERCGEPATENVSEVADEHCWRCPKCVPRDVMPKLKNWPKVGPKKLERQWVMR